MSKEPCLKGKSSSAATKSTTTTKTILSQKGGLPTAGSKLAAKRPSLVKTNGLRSEGLDRPSFDGNGRPAVLSGMRSPVAASEVFPKPASKEIKINFKENDKIVYPGHGVGVINTIQAKSIGGETHHIFEITIMETGMRVMVPVVQAQAVGIRKVIDKKSVEKVFSILRDRDFKIDTQTWNRRFREYSNKIKTGSPFEIAEVLRDLSVLSVDKQLSFGEKKMLDMAQSLLVSEIAIAKARSADKVIGEIKACFQ